MSVGDDERRLKLPVSKTCDRYTNSVVQVQSGKCYMCLLFKTVVFKFNLVSVTPGFSATWKILKTWNLSDLEKAWNFSQTPGKYIKTDFHALFNVTNCDSRNRKMIMNHDIIINSLNLDELTFLIM